MKIEMNRIDKWLITDMITERIAKLKNKRERIKDKENYQEFIGFSIPTEQKIKEIDKEIDKLMELLNKIKGGV